jgi:hypothetical protein
VDQNSLDITANAGFAERDDASTDDYVTRLSTDDTMRGRQNPSLVENATSTEMCVVRISNPRNHQRHLPWKLIFFGWSSSNDFFARALAKRTDGFCIGARRIFNRAVEGSFEWFGCVYRGTPGKRK